MSSVGALDLSICFMTSLQLLSHYETIW